jgi:hypothetical protein
MPIASEGSLHGRSVLVVSHDFAPWQSPQALRALAFVRRLAREAARVTVLTRTAQNVRSDSDLPENVRVLRASAGFLEDFLEKRSKPRAGVEGPAEHVPSVTRPHSLNWKGRTVALVRRSLDQLCFPDGRVLWVAPARRILELHCQTDRPDVALVMHEPAASLILGHHLASLGIPWVADLADPVLAPYTPAQWCRAALRLESSVVAKAGAISVTNIGTAELISKRHGIALESIVLLPQGFESTPALPPLQGAPLRLVYTGRFYRFRDPTALLSAVTNTPGVLLQIAGPEMPASIQAAARANPDSIQLMGELDHSSAIALQKSAHVLVSIGNTGTTQTPGKIQEYFGASRPILHIAHDDSDPAPAFLAQIQRGVSCRANAVEIGGKLRDLAARNTSGILDANFNLGQAIVAAYHWDSIVSRLATMLAGLLADNNHLRTVNLLPPA